MFLTLRTTLSHYSPRAPIRVDGTARALMACAIAGCCAEARRLHGLGFHATGKALMRTAAMVGHDLGATKGFTCADCGGVAHPATGHAYSATMLICGPCTRRVFRWVATHTNKRASKRAKVRASFYEAAGRKVV